MQPSTWTDERLDDLSRRMDAGFARVDADIRELRILLLQLGGGMIVGLLGVIAAILAS